MREMLRHLPVKFPLFDIVIRQIKRAKAYHKFRKEFYDFKNMSLSGRFIIEWEDRRPCLNDKTDVTNFDRHYVYHPAWAARIIKQLNPEVHIDIGSSLLFISIISVLIPVRFYDYRPAELYLDGLECKEGDLLHLPFADKSIESLSCMHVVEHIGLGRYGDSLDPEDDIKAMKELQRVVKSGGNLLFVVPIGSNPRVIFNAHRIYNYSQIIKQFSELELMKFSLIPQLGPNGIVDGKKAVALVPTEEYGCGCFWFMRPEETDSQ